MTHNGGIGQEAWIWVLGSAFDLATRAIHFHKLRPALLSVKWGECLPLLQSQIC